MLVVNDDEDASHTIPTAAALLLVDELWFRILSFVPSSDLLQRVHPTCRRLSNLVRDQSFWLHHKCGNKNSSNNDDNNNELWKRLGHRQRQRCSLFHEWFVAHQQQQQQQPSARHDESRSMMTLYTTSNDAALAAAPSYLRFGNVLPSRRTASQFLEDSVLEYNSHCPRVCCIATSTDNHRIERIENVLVDTDDNGTNSQPQQDDDHDSDIDNEVNTVRTVLRRLSRRRRMLARLSVVQRWWSSAPTPTPDSTDRLVFCSHSPLCLVTSIAIQPLRDPYGQPHKVYSWNQTRIQCFQIPVERLVLPSAPAQAPCSFPEVGEAPYNFNANSGPTIQALLQGQEPVYTSPPLDMMRNSDDTVHHDVDGSLLVVANVIVLELIGKHTEQRTGTSGYYACVERVQVQGIPLATVVGASAP